MHRRAARSSSRPLVFHSGRGAIERSILYRLTDMMRGDRARAVEVGNRARDFQDARVGARAQAEAIDRQFQQALAARLDLAMEPQIARAHLRVAEERHPGEAGKLRLARA